jgi:hypothetical protein
LEFRSTEAKPVHAYSRETHGKQYGFCLFAFVKARKNRDEMFSSASKTVLVPEALLETELAAVTSCVIV